MSDFKPIIMQMAWVVPNLEEAAKRWHKELGIGPFLVNRNIQVRNALHRQNPATAQFSTAVAQSGDVQIELVEQHDDGPSVYRDTVAAGATAFHHVAFIAEDYDAAVKHYTDRGYELGTQGYFGEMRYAYVDTHATLGHMVEILEDTPGIRAFCAAIQKSAERWDGNPDTLLREL